MKTTVEQLIKERTFESLTAEELKEVSELCATEEEFNSMKHFFGQIDHIAASDKTIINPEIKHSLDTIFAAKFPGIRANWNAPEAAAPVQAPVIPLYQRTWVRVAAVALLVLGTIPLWQMIGNDRTMVENETLAKLEQPRQKQAAAKEQDTTPTSATEGNNTTAQAPGIEDEAAEEQETIAADEAAATIELYGGIGTYRTITSPRFETDKDVSNRNEALGSLSRTFNGFATVQAPENVGIVGHVTVTDSYASMGRMADLNPGGEGLYIADQDAQSIASLSMAAQPDDLFDLLVPAF